MSRSAGLLLLLPALAVAAPVPKLTPKTFDGFGTAVETKGVTFESPQAGELRVSLSKEATTGSQAHFVARPLVTQKVEGDFELTVRVTHAPPEAKDLAAVGKNNPVVSAGLALSSPDDPNASVVLLHRHIRDGDTWESTFNLSSRYGKKGSDSCRVSEKLHQQPIYLRLTRRGDEFTSAQSFDGKKWSSVFGSAHEVPGLGAVLIGPVAGHNTNGQYEVTFDEYVLKPLTEKRK